VLRTSVRIDQAITLAAKHGASGDINAAISLGLPGRQGLRACDVADIPLIPVLN